MIVFHGVVSIAQVVWSFTLQEFKVWLADHCDVRVVIVEFLLHPPFGDKCQFLWFVRVCDVLRDIWGEMNNRDFRARDRDPCMFGP